MPSSVIPTRGSRLGASFFRQSATDVARQLIGAILVRRIDRTLFRARITETEAYLGPADLASHSAKGRTRRTEVMFGPAGHAYVYLIYGMHDMLNVVTGVTGEAHAVLLRAAEPLGQWDADLKGPGRLARGFRITRADNGASVTGSGFYFLRDASASPRILATPRIGIDYAQEWKHALLRFVAVVDTANRPRRAVVLKRTRP